MEIRCWFTGFEIEEVDDDYLTGFRSNPIDMVEPGYPLQGSKGFVSGNKVYALRGTGWQGFVVGGILLVHEDQGDLMGPSALLSGEPR
jgi:hypothetical protein